MRKRCLKLPYIHHNGYCLHTHNHFSDYNYFLRHFSQTFWQITHRPDAPIWRAFPNLVLVSSERDCGIPLRVNSGCLQGLSRRLRHHVKHLSASVMAYRRYFLKLRGIVWYAWRVFVLKFEALSDGGVRRFWCDILTGSFMLSEFEKAWRETS